MAFDPAAPLENPPDTLQPFDPAVLDRLRADLEPGGAGVVARLVDRYAAESQNCLAALRLAHWCREVERLNTAGDLALAAEALAQAEATQAEDWPALEAYRRRLA